VAALSAPALTLVLLAGVAACASDSRESLPSGAPKANEPGFGDGPVEDRVLVKLFDSVPGCDVEHRGVSIDFGTDATLGRVTTASALESKERDAATWATLVDSEVQTTFRLIEPTRLFGSARLSPIEAKSVSFYVDGIAIGSIKLKPGVDQIVSTPPTEAPFDPGEHVLTMRFKGKRRDSEGVAAIDWVRAGFPDDLEATYGAPTLADVLQEDAALGKVPRRALRLTSPSTVRCSLRVPPGARLRTALGLLGTGEDDVRIVLRRDGQEVVKLLERHLKPTDAWEDVDASLEAYAGQIVHLELSATQATRGARILFGDPEILVSTRRPDPTPTAQVVVLVVLAGVTRAELPGYADRNVAYLDNLAKLTRNAAIFADHRAVSNVAAGNLATLLTGLPPSVHTVTDLGSALPRRVPTIPERARDAGVQTAMFTAVPTSFEPYNFGRAMTRFVAISPSEGEPRSALAEAADFLTKTLEREPSARLFLVVHAEGGHPPWSPTQKQLDSLPPEKYTGDIQPRRAAQQLAALRRKRGKVRLLDADRVRVEALHQTALARQDAELGKLLAAVGAADVEDRSLIVVTNDISAGVEEYFPEELPFDERSLEAPLIVSFPRGLASGRAVREPTTVEDVSTTIAAALGVSVRKPWGRDLLEIASGLPLETDDVRYALFGESHTARWGTFVLRERASGPPEICDVAIDWTCAFDRRATHPLLAGALRVRHAAFERRTAQSRYERQTVELDDATSAALRIWGATQ
jgi:arylsulfatase A-like enzyme